MVLWRLPRTQSGGDLAARRPHQAAIFGPTDTVASELQAFLLCWAPAVPAPPWVHCDLTLPGDTLSFSLGASKSSTGSWDELAINSVSCKRERPGPLAASFTLQASSAPASPALDTLEGSRGRDSLRPQPLPATP